MARSLPRGCLRMRDYIHMSLYDPSRGYFMKGSGPVLPPLTNMPSLASIPSRDAYDETVAARYGQAHGWLTPVELFTPYFSNAIARRVMSSHVAGDALHIVEVGAGRGRLASDVLSFIREYRPEVLPTCRYTIFEISPVLAELQENLLLPWIESGHAEVLRTSVLDVTSCTENEVHSEMGVHLIACEVLDNMAHDLVRVDGNGNLYQAYVDVSGRVPALVWSSAIHPHTGQALDAFELLDGPSSLLDSVRNALERFVSSGSADIWVPVDAYRMLQEVSQRLSLRSLTVADFAFLPGAMPGTNAPVVQRVDRGSARVYPSLLDAPFGLCDIMFPTNFFDLDSAIRKCLPVETHCSSAILTQRQFFERFSSRDDLQASTCKDGWNPVLSEFANASVLLCDPQ